VNSSKRGCHPVGLLISSKALEQFAENGADDRYSVVVEKFVDLTAFHRLWTIEKWNQMQVSISTNVSFFTCRIQFALLQRPPIVKHFDLARKRFQLHPAGMSQVVMHRHADGHCWVGLVRRLLQLRID
jgi:hypothetical protein